MTNRPRLERAEGVGKLVWEDMVITWAVYTPREVQRTAAEKPTLCRPVHIKCEFTAPDGERYEALGEHFIDAIAFQRITKDDWPKRCVELAKATVRSAVAASRMN